MNLKLLPNQVKTRLSAFSLRWDRASVVSTIVLLACPALALAKDIDWDSLNLSPQQEVQIERLEDSWEKTHAEVGTQIQRDMAELRNILPTGDSQRIRGLQNRITTNKTYLMNQSMDIFLKKRDMLTPAQRNQLQQMIPVKYHQ